MTSPNGATPEGAYVAGGSGQQAVTDLNHLTEDVARARMRQQVTPSFDAQRNGLWARFQDLLDAMAGRYSGALPMFVDGQLALNKRFDLLGDSGFCAAYMSQHLRLGPGRNRALPFDAQIGPRNDAELVQVTRSQPNVAGGPYTEWCIRLDRRGLWQADVAFVHAGDGYDHGFAEISVLRPDLSIYSVTTLPDPVPRMDGGGITDVHRGVPMVIPKRFVVPGPGYYVQVRWQFMAAFGIRTAKGGAQLSQFSVVQWSDKVADATTDDGAVGTVDDTA